MKFLASLIVASLVSAAAFAQSSAIVDVTLNPMGDFKAKTSQIKGFAVVKGDTVSAQNIVVSLKSLKTGVELRDKHTLKYLEVGKHPNAVLLSAVGKGGKGQGKIQIKGIVKDIKGTYQVDGGFLKARFALKLSDFGITDISYMGVGVEDEVMLNVAVPIKK